MTADLHVHTNLSDGTQTPEKVVIKAKKAGLKTIAITDHDVVEGIGRAKVQGAIEGIEVIEGIEFSTEALKTEIHILGYFIDVKNQKLLETIAVIQKAREERIVEMCGKLKVLGLDLDPEKVFLLAGHRAAGRPHVARALVKEKLVGSFKEAFDKYIAFGGPAYVSHYKLSPQEAVQLVNQAGGLAVYAHPAVSKADELIPGLVDIGLAGIEVYYYSYGPEQVKHYEEICRQHKLLMTGGSDYHGIKNARAIKLGDFTIPDELVEKLKHEHLYRNRP